MPTIMSAVRRFADALRAVPVGESRGHGTAVVTRTGPNEYRIGRAVLTRQSAAKLLILVGGPTPN